MVECNNILVCLLFYVGTYPKFIIVFSCLFFSNPFIENRTINELITSILGILCIINNTTLPKPNSFAK